MDEPIDITDDIEEILIKEEIHFAGFFVRLLARILDIIIIAAIINLLFYLDTFGANRRWWVPMPIPGDAAMIDSDFLNMGNIIRGLFYMGIHPLYYIILHGMGGQTLGKMAFKLKVVDVSEVNITMGQSIIRWLGYLICDITLGIGYLVILFSRKKQGLQDKIANTIVIHLNEK